MTVYEKHLRKTEQQMTLWLTRAKGHERNGKSHNAVIAYVKVSFYQKRADRIREKLFK